MRIVNTTDVASKKRKCFFSKHFWEIHPVAVSFPSSIHPSFYPESHELKYSRLISRVEYLQSGAARLSDGTVAARLCDGTVAAATRIIDGTTAKRLGKGAAAPYLQ